MGRYKVHQDARYRPGIGGEPLFVWQTNDAFAIYAGEEDAYIHPFCTSKSSLVELQIYFAELNCPDRIALGKILWTPTKRLVFTEPKDTTVIERIIREAVESDGEVVRYFGDMMAETSGGYRFGIIKDFAISPN
jgi:hypothetical protein